MFCIFLSISLYALIVLIYRLLRRCIRNHKIQHTLDIIIALPFYLLLLYSTISLLLPFVTHSSSEARNRSAVTLICLVILVAVDYFYLRKNKKIEQHAPKSTRGTKQLLHAEQKRFFILDLIAFLFSAGSTHFWPTEYEQDIRDIQSFDRYLQMGETVVIPKMRTEKGQVYLKQYLRAYAKEHSPYPDTVSTNTPSDNDQWQCPCGRTNPSYTSTCVCGKNKRDTKTP